ncbi:MAG: ATP-binding protein [Deltaproteobacteria bacterium]|nr:ATP-binding protein [Deltaproteobacteria bacterium]
MKPKNMPLADPPFREIIDNNLLYADKTKYVFDMVNGPRLLFLTRPRRFGKTLLLDTLEELFLGNRELFKDLWIGTDSDYAFERHPVLRLNMAYSGLSTKKDLEDRIKNELRLAAENEKIKINSDSIDEILKDYLTGVSKQYGVGVAVLIDEYDAPVSGQIMNHKLALDNVNVLRDFYTSIKTNRKSIRFALVTGITRFAMTALDSGPNSFVDISLAPEYASICGFTVSELTTYFGDRFDETLASLKAKGGVAEGADRESLKEMILKWYDGYNWLGQEQVLNPYSILYFFKEKYFDGFWISLGPPRHISSLLKKTPMDFIQPNLDYYAAGQIGKIELNRITPVSVLFNSGYLTIDKAIFKDVVKKGVTTKVKMFSFRPPNLEVDLNFQSSFFKHAFNVIDSDFNNFAAKFPIAMLNKDSKTVANLLHNLLAAVIFFKNESTEKHFHSMLHMAFLAVGLEVLSEISAGDGRSDIVVILENKIRVVIELKYRRAYGKREISDVNRAAKELAAALDDAEKQIKEKDYAAPHRAANREVILLALAIRGKDQVAARFVTPEKSDSPQDI